MEFLYIVITAVVALGIYRAGKHNGYTEGLSAGSDATRAIAGAKKVASVPTTETTPEATPAPVKKDTKKVEKEVVKKTTKKVVKKTK